MSDADTSEIELVLGAKRSRRVDVAVDSADAPVTSMAAFGFPALHATTMFLAVDAVTSLEGRGEIEFPPTCCVCEAPVARRLPTCSFGGLVARWLRAPRPGPLAACVPHCAAHADGRCARLLVRRQGWSLETTALSFVGWNDRFLSEVVAINRRGEAFSPWRAFPAMSAESSGWRQGNGEHWWRQCWEPFWRGLDRAAALDYLDRWHAPDEWRARLLTP
jgi:hypothetical protein